MFYDAFNYDRPKRSKSQQFYRNLQQENAHLDGYIQMIDGIQWDFFATGTTGYTMTLKSARRLMEGLHKKIRENVGHDCTMFWVAEPFEVKEGFHTHALIKVSHEFESDRAELDAKRFEKEKFMGIIKQWQLVTGNKKMDKKKWNRIDLQKYNPSRGAGGYCSKYVLKSSSDYDLLI